ncbi:MAG: InlB B-repeat-containing protein, partial [Clostridia bacterium]|nr:InlB B-repeat-containing protein [Clostridia bacterium]
GNIIVNVNDGGEITTLKTNFESTEGKLAGDYVIYLNDGTIGTVEAFNGGTISGNTVLIVDANNAEVPANIADLQNLVSFTGDGEVEFDTANDKLVLIPGETAKFVRVTNGDNAVVYDVATGEEVELLSEGDLAIDLEAGTTTVEFLEKGTIKQAFYKTYGTYDVNNMTYTLDLVFTGAKVSAGSFGFSFPEEYMTFTEVYANADAGIVLVPEEGSFKSPVFAKSDNYYANTWTPEVLGYLDATEEEILIATFEFTMDREQREAFVEEMLNVNGKFEQYVKPDIDLTDAKKYYSIEEDAYLVTAGEDMDIVYVPIEYVSHTEDREIVSAEYTTYGTYTPSTEEYTIDIKVKGGKINLGAFGLTFDSDYMTFNTTDEDAVVLADGIERFAELNNSADGYAFVYYASNNDGYIDATDEEVLIATIKVGMDETQREAFVDAGATMEIFEPVANDIITPSELANYFDGENYIVSVYEDSLDEYKVAAEYKTHTDEVYEEPEVYTVKLSDLSGKQGETVTLTVSLENYESFSSTGMGVKVAYDSSVVEFVRVVDFQKPSSMLNMCNKSVNSDTLAYTFSDASNVSLDNAVLFTAEFKLIGEPGEYVDVFSITEAYYADANNQGVDFATQVGTVTIEAAVAPEPETYTVTYLSGKGTAPEAVSVEAGTTITLSAPEAYTGYVFYNWTDGVNTYFAGDEYEITGDVTFTAIWYQKGDVNMNGSVNVADAIWIFDYISDKNAFENDTHQTIADMNNNGSINIADAIEIFNYIAS